MGSYLTKILGAILLCASLTGLAQTMKLELSIDSTPCTEKRIVEAIKEEYRPQLFNVTMGGIRYCGVINPVTGQIAVVDETDIVATLSVEAFK